MAKDAKAVAADGLPVLLIDTCSILDFMRDPTRGKPQVHEHQAALDLLAAAEAGLMNGIIADQVALEFPEHDQLVQNEANNALEKLCSQINHVNEFSAILGAPGQLNLSHLSGHVARTRAIVDRWLTQLVPYKPSDQAVIDGIARMNKNIAPAVRGKDSSKDCIIFETYLEYGELVRTEGLTAPIVFLSSNTHEYLTDGRILKTEIEKDLSRLKIDYAPNMAAAKHQLGA